MESHPYPQQPVLLVFHYWKTTISTLLCRQNSIGRPATLVFAIDNVLSPGVHARHPRRLLSRKDVMDHPCLPYAPIRPCKDHSVLAMRLRYYMRSWGLKQTAISGYGITAPAATYLSCPSDAVTHRNGAYMTSFVCLITAVFSSWS